MTRDMLRALATCSPAATVPVESWYGERYAPTAGQKRIRGPKLAVVAPIRGTTLARLPVVTCDSGQQGLEPGGEFLDNNE